MKHMTRNHLHEHRARERMRALRGETVKPVGKRPGGDDHGACVCGFHVCNCPTRFEVTGKVKPPWHAFDTDALRPKGPLLGYAVGKSVPREDGLHAVTIDLGYRLGDYIGPMPSLTPWIDNAPPIGIAPTFTRAEMDRAVARMYGGRLEIVASAAGGEPLGVLWLREFGPVSMGDMRGMCEGHAFTQTMITSALTAVTKSPAEDQPCAMCGYHSCKEPSDVICRQRQELGVWRQ